MQLSALHYLCCLRCRHALRCHAEYFEGEHVIEGRLTCFGCDRSYRISRGVPILLDDVSPTQRKIAHAFAYEWTNFPQMYLVYEVQFLEWIAPIKPAFFAGRVVLDAGCGKGRHSYYAGKFGAKAVIAVDISDAAYVAFNNTRHLGNVHVVQADVLNLPVRAEFDFVFSIGVLNLIEFPQRAFNRLSDLLRPRGSILVWVYAKEGNSLIMSIGEILRRWLAYKISHVSLKVFSFLLALPFWGLLRVLYRPFGNSLSNAKRQVLPLQQYCTYLSQFSFRVVQSVIFDHLVTPVVYYLSREEFSAWFERADLQDVTITLRNRNSWRGCATLRR